MTNDLSLFVRMHVVGPGLRPRLLFQPLFSCLLHFACFNVCSFLGTTFISDFVYIWQGQIGVSPARGS
jgi:hypothetical protein